MRPVLIPVSLSLLLSACQPNDCSDPSFTHVQGLPRLLSETGLAVAGGQPPGLRAYTPRFELWSDGAQKRRWFLLPDGAQIDTSVPDDWRFPRGTKFWKEFTRDGVRVETRILWKWGDGRDDWSMAAYLWRPDQTDAELVPAGVRNALGTPHDVPTAGQCWACHGGRASRILGVSEVQLDPALLPDTRMFTRPVNPPQLPGSALDHQALGYLHANCSHCHNQTAPSDGPRCYDPWAPFDFTLPSRGVSDVLHTPALLTAEDVLRAGVVPMAMEGRIGLRMPPVASERVDATAVSLIEQWTATLPE
jgi:hypothetical protein